MNWLLKTCQSLEYSMAGGQVSGLTVLDNIPNMDSISSSFEKYEILPGIREIPLWAGTPQDSFYAKDDIDTSQQLAEFIQQSGEISPLILVVSSDGDSQKDYILEGGHRLVALQLLGVQSFPALVVIDRDEDFEA